MINEDQELSKNFWLSAFAKSSDEPELVALTEFTEAQIARAGYFCKFLLQPLRDYIGPVGTTCGNRSMYNDRVSTNKNSDHLWRDETESLAVDIRCKDLGKAFTWLIHHRAMFKMVYLDMEQKFIHISALDTTRLAGRIFVKCGKKQVNL